MENSDYSRTRVLRFRRMIRRMPLSLVHKLADKNNVDIPFDISDPFRISNILLDELSDKTIEEVLERYGDAGKPSSYFFICKGKTSPLEMLTKRSNEIISLEPESKTWEHYPYFEEVKVHNLTKTFRIRFHYFKGAYTYLDVETGTIREHRLVYPGVVIYRPQRSILEIRTKHRSIARKVANRTAAYLGLQSFYSLNLLEEKYIKKFIDWIHSLNNARIELPIIEATGSLILTARRGKDLRTLKRFHDELRRGRLRGGHVTIEREDERQINFNVYFRGCHLWFTSFCEESDIEFVVDALEKIMEGYEFGVPERLLTEFFKKEA